MDQLISKIGGNFSGGANLPHVPIIKVGGDVSATYDNGIDFERIDTSYYRNEVLTTRSSGVANEAIWEFKQGGVTSMTGEYDIMILFKVRAYVSELNQLQSRLKYEIQPTSKINDKEIKNDLGQLPVREMYLFV